MANGVGWIVRALRAWSALGVLVLAACGGGGGGSTGIVDTPPVTTPAPSATPPDATVTTLANSATAKQAIVSLTSEAGDFVGSGASYAYDSNNAAIRLTARGAYLGVQVTGRQSWSGDFLLPGTGTELKVGTYANLGRYPFQSSGAGALSWSGEGRGCNVVSGSITVNSVSYDRGVLTALDLSFEQHCEGRTPALKGQIRVDAGTIGAVTAPQNALSATPVVELVSESGDYIGIGARYAYDDVTAQLKLQAIGNRLTVQVAGDQTWNGDFQMPGNGTVLQPGVYAQLTRYPFQAAGAGGLSWYGEGRGCNMLTGSWTINSVRYDAAGALAAIDMDFEQHCEGATPALRGHIRWDAAAANPPPAPVTPLVGLWSPPAGAMPASDNAMYFASDWGDFIGGAYTYWVTGSTGTPPPSSTPGNTQGSASLAMSESGGLFKITLSGKDINWSGEFKAMDGLTRLQPGYYGIVSRYPFQNPRRGGLSWSMDGRGCNTLSGWFMVDSISYEADKLAAIDLRFAQHCDGNPAAFRGRIRWKLGSSTAR